MQAETMIGAAKRKAEIKKKKEQEIFFKVLKKAFTTVADTPDGIIALRYIMEQSGWLGDLIVGDPSTGNIHDNATLYNVSRRLCYKQIRNFIPVRALKKIEFETTNFKGEIEDD